MTRINLISVEELSDQHLLAEYRELPRIVNAVIKNKINTKNIPEHYVLGKGHVKFFYNKILFLQKRYEKIFNELQYRGFLLNQKFSPKQMQGNIKKSGYDSEKTHIFTEEEINLSRNRIIEKIQKRPSFYKWTKRAD